MTDTPRPAPFVIADHLALDFLNSRCAPWGEEIDWITDGPDLVDWMRHVGMIDPGWAAQCQATGDLRALHAVAAQARDLREWMREIVMDHAGQSLPASVLDRLGPLNALLAEDRSCRQIVATPDGGLDWRSVPEQTQPAHLLRDLAGSMADLLCHADFTRVKNCEGPSCTMWFLDTSKNQSRRWCSMAVCGNRAKAAAFRARRQTRD